jgi:hypothetical protein
MTTPCVYTIQHSIFWCVVVAEHFLICLVGNCATNSVTSGRKFLDVVRRNFIQILASTLLSWGEPRHVVTFPASSFVYWGHGRHLGRELLDDRPNQGHTTTKSRPISRQSLTIHIPLAWNKHKAARLLDPTTVLEKGWLCVCIESQLKCHSGPDQRLSGRLVHPNTQCVRDFLIGFNSSRQ